ncbi:Molybdate/tungstate import ATP-binding protein WtpC [Candidatus Tiddalikarchaeum anstoanum]|nr:Molybdate/tungstate import ATP-binding protein WtpC [Candidatus Tiddalikarchaeum anstoanum]
MRVIVVDKKKCTGGKGCEYACIKVCPINRTGKDCIIAGPDKKIIIDESLCIGCGLCVKRCPFDAVKVVNIPKELDTQEIQRYGVNGFRLFNLVIPQKKQVIGLIGVNGIGKSTCLNVLAGHLKPNLGKINDPFNPQKVIDYFKGTEAQSYFEKLYANGLSTAYKPQYIEEIPKLYKGTVRAMLEKIKPNIDRIVSELNISYILDRNITDISGGELQRVAIAASLLKNSEFLFVDEPSSYLDIKQRLKISKLLRAESENKDCTIVVEHDLILLDYLSDVGHILYGQSGSYGIVSKALSIRECINTYLEGYIREDNMRFRETEIKFEVRAPTKSFARFPLVSWNEIKKSLGNFNITVSPGKLMMNEIVGIVGENGTGKTTFAKMVAGLITPDSGELSTALKISYKPQYIKFEEDTIVRLLLMKTHVNLLERLNIMHLMNRKLSELSGGELQRVAIADCLSREADIYLLDEPSAHLDVEQRLNVAKILRDIIKEKQASALVIDHDILFIDYLSDRLLVFLGNPGLDCFTKGPVEMREGMNIFLKDLDITFRRDKDSKRPRANKKDSQMDTEQKTKGEYYYA